MLGKSVQFEIWRRVVLYIMRLGGEGGVWLGATESGRAAGVRDRVQTVGSGEVWVGAGVVRGT